MSRLKALANSLISKVDRRGLTRRKVDVIIGGAQRCGTTTLHSICVGHPDFIPGNTKEVGYFHRTPAYRLGDGWYHSHFPARWNVGRNQVIFDATPDYLFCKKCPARIYTYNPLMKAIFTFRNPALRAFSQWNLLKRLIVSRSHVLRRTLDLCHPDIRDPFLKIIDSAVCPSFEEMIEMELANIGMVDGDEQVFPNLLRRGLYGEQIERWLKIFPREQMFFMNLADLKRDPHKVLVKVSRFVGVSTDFPALATKNANPERYEDVMLPATREMLDRFFSKDIKRFQEATGFTVE